VDVGWYADAVVGNGGQAVERVVIIGGLASKRIVAKMLI